MRYLLILFFFLTSCDFSPAIESPQLGDKIDSLNGVFVYENVSMGNVSGRNVTPDGYNLGLKYQCVEFVKRYYYQHLNHQMPNSYGNAKDFFNKSLGDGQLNIDRNLLQYSNGGKYVPNIGDLIVFDGTIFNSFGHVAIISDVKADEVEIIQQNCSRTREVLTMNVSNDSYTIETHNVLGWLRK